MKMPPSAWGSVNLPEATTHSHINPPQSSAPREKGGWQEMDFNVDVFLSPLHLTAQDGAEGHVHPKNWCCGLESFTMALSLWCLWQDGITQADLSMNGTIWAHTIFLWPVNYIVWTFSAYLKGLKWTGYRKEALKPFHWQSHSHGVTLPFSKETRLVTWVKYTLAKSHSTKLPTGYSHRNSHTATFSFIFRILKMWVTLHQKQYVILTPGGMSPPGLTCLGNSKKKVFWSEKKAVLKSLQDAKIQLIVQHKYGKWEITEHKSPQLHSLRRPETEPSFLWI